MWSHIVTRGDIKSLIEANLTKLETAQLLIEVLAGYDTGCAGGISVVLSVIAVTLVLFEQWV